MDIDCYLKYLPLTILIIFLFFLFAAIRDAQVKAKNDIPVAGDEYVNRTDSVVFTRPISEGTDIKGNEISYLRLDKLKHCIKLVYFLFI